ncbi:hypothetical protein WN51_12595 [Melipona quadrifasciata]|uniref:Uncharacterized protein n=1 Tax=Melipona quadrifasciata TaxID=166423 RepID=A0A0M9A2E5_9HYME|nr:hypothetical protein WN51_12595 [Melipona quadrifasciata]
MFGNTTRFYVQDKCRSSTFPICRNLYHRCKELAAVKANRKFVHNELSTVDNVFRLHGRIFPARRIRLAEVQRRSSVNKGRNARCIPANS